MLHNIDILSKIIKKCYLLIYILIFLYSQSIINLNASV